MSMTLAAFLAITQFYATIVANFYTMEDGIIIIASPQLTVLDFELCAIAVAEIWSFWEWLREF